MKKDADLLQIITVATENDQAGAIVYNTWQRI